MKTLVNEKPITVDGYEIPVAVAFKIHNRVEAFFNGDRIVPANAGVKPEPQPPKPQPVASVEKPPVEVLHLDGGKMPKPKNTRRQRAFSHETTLFLCKLETARRERNKERNRATTLFFSVVSVVRHFRFYAKQWSIKLTPPVTQEIVAWLKGVKDNSIQTCISALVFNHQPSTN